MAIKGKVISGVKKLQNIKFFGNIKDKFKIKTKEERAEDTIVSLKEQLLKLEERLESETNIYTRKRISAKLDVIEQQLTRKVEEKNIRASIKDKAQKEWTDKQEEYDSLQEELESLIAQKEDLEVELAIPYEALSKFDEKEHSKRQNDSRMEKLVKNRDKVFGNNTSEKNEEQEQQVEGKEEKEEKLVSVRNVNGEIVKLKKSQYQDWAIGIEQQIADIESLIEEKEASLDEKFEFLQDGFAKDFKEKMSTELKPYKENIFKKLFNNTIGTWIQGFKDWNQNRKDVRDKIDEAKKQVLQQREDELKNSETDRKEARRQSLEKMGIFVENSEIDNSHEKTERHEEERTNNEEGHEH